MVLTSFHDKKSSLEMWCICRLTTPEVKTDPDSRESQSPDPLSDGESNMADCDQIPLAEDDSILSDGPSIAGTMDQEQLEEQLAKVQDMVLEMKQGFTMVMESLGKIQFGDQSLQKQMAENQSFCQTQISDMTASITSLKNEIHSMSTQLGSVSTTQKLLEERMETYQIERDGLLAELERCGAISEKMRVQYQGASDPPPDTSPSLPSTISPMVQPYLASLQQHRDDQCQSEASVTALACKSLSLSQALHDRCLHLDLSASSDEDDRHAQSNAYHGLTDNNYYSDRGIGQKIPPHEKIREEVHRERAAQSIVESEQAYCSSLWTLIDGFMNPLRQEEIMSAKDLNLVFPSYISHLYEQHCIILRKLEERLAKYKTSGIIGDVFAKLADTCDGDGLTLYKEYIADFPAVVNSMNRWFSQSMKFRDIMKGNSLATCPVLPLLRAPLQQIPQYTLLIKELLKYTSADHPDRYYLESSLSKLKNFIVIMNDELEHSMQLLNVKGMKRASGMGTSLRSRSSGSSCDANQTSSARDSGILSNGEENGSKMLASPNTTRKYVLQVAGRDYEQSSDPRNRSLPLLEENSFTHQSSMGRNQSLPVLGNPKGGYTSHSAHVQQRFYNQDPPERTYNDPEFTSRLQNSIASLPPSTAQDSDRQVRQIKFRQQPSGQSAAHTPSNRRSLTPSSFHMNSTPDARSVNDSRLLRPRPSSAIDFGPSERDAWSEHMFQQVRLSPRTDLRGLHKHGIGLSPRPGYGRKEELHHSLQRLLEERELLEYQMNGENYAEENPELIDSSLAVGSSANAVTKQMNPNLNVPQMNSSHNENSRTSDYGVYGDDDDDSRTVSSSDIRLNNGSSFSHNLTNSKASTGFHPSHDRNESCSKEELAISLAHSLSGGSANFSSSTSAHHSDIETSSSQNYQVETLSSGKVHIVNMKPVQNGIETDDRDKSYEQPKSQQNHAPSSGSGSISALNSVMSDLRKYADSVSENRSPPPYQPNLGGQSLLHSKPEEISTEQAQFERSEVKPVFRKQLSEKASSRTSRLTQPHSRAYSTKKMSAVGEADIKLNIDRNSNLSPSRLPRPLGSPGSHENHPFPTQPQKMGYRSEDNSKVTKSAVDQRDGSKERSVGTSKERSAGTSNSKDSRIPQRRLKSLKTPAETISKSSEDLSKMRKKSALKHSIKNFFGKKRKSAKIGKEFSSSIDLSTNTNFFDPDFAMLSLEDQLGWPDNEREMSVSQTLMTGTEDYNTPCSAV